jgi:hypothetical protein
MFGVTVNDLRRLEFQIAELNHFSHIFNKDKETAGKKWYYGFMRRHPHLILRQPKAISLSGTQSFSGNSSICMKELLR